MDDYDELTAIDASLGSGAPRILDESVKSAKENDFRRLHWLFIASTDSVG